MERQSSLDEAQILKQAQQGNAEAIATALNYFLYRRHAQVSVTWKGNDLLMLLDCTAVLPQHPTSLFIRQVMQRLNLSQLRMVHIYARNKGQATIAWIAAVEMKPSEPIDPNLAVLDWLHQGELGESRDAELRNLESSTGSTGAIASLKVNLLGEADTERFLSVSVGADLKTDGAKLEREAVFLLPLDSIQDVFHLSLHHILTVPGVPSYVLGVYQHRGHMVWIYDLAQRLGTASTVTTSLNVEFDAQAMPHDLAQTPSTPSTLDSLPHQTATYPVLTALSGEHRVGFLVARINTIESHPVSQMRQPDGLLFPEPLMPFLAGYHSPSTSPVLSPQLLAMATVA